MIFDLKDSPGDLSYVSSTCVFGVVHWLSWPLLLFFICRKFVYGFVNCMFCWASACNAFKFWICLGSFWSSFSGSGCEPLVAKETRNVSAVGWERRHQDSQMAPTRLYVDSLGFKLNPQKMRTTSGEHFNCFRLFQGFSAPKFAKISAPPTPIVLVSSRALETNI